MVDEFSEKSEVELLPLILSRRKHVPKKIGCINNFLFNTSLIEMYCF